MKKFFAILAIVALASCGGSEAPATEGADTVTVTPGPDTTVAPGPDTTVAPGPDTTAAAAPSEGK